MTVLIDTISWISLSYDELGKVREHSKARSRAAQCCSFPKLLSGIAYGTSVDGVISLARLNLQ